MSSTINAATTGGGGVITTADASGILQLQTGGTTAVTIDASQNVVLAKGLTVGATAAPAFSAYQSTLQALPAATYTKMLFQTEEFDTNSNYDTTTSRFTPTVAGYYQVNTCYQVSATAGQLISSVYKNGVAYKYGGVASVASLASVSAIVFCNGSTDYIEIFTSTSVAQNSFAGSIAATYFQAAMIRGA